jgi:hypothetical protein
MGMHIADPEVIRLVAALAKSEGTTKTEALRRLLRKTMADRQKEMTRAGFRKFATGLMAEARLKKIAPASKAEMDDLWGMKHSDGD